MNSDNSNFIEPTPERLSKEISIQYGYPQQITQEEEKEDVRVDSKEANTKDEDKESTKSLPHKYNNNRQSSSNSHSIKNNDITTSNKNTSKNKPPHQRSVIIKKKNYESAHPLTQRPEVNLNDIQGLTYRYNKELSRIAIPKNEAFMDRMLFDIFKRQEKEAKINQIIKNNSIRLNSNDRRKAFNRLIDDANRRIEVKDLLEENKAKLYEEHVFDHLKPKKYKDDEWNGIYNERFIKFQYEKERKQIENVKIKKDQERKTEEKVIELCKSKKAPMKIIKENVQRMYDDALKKRLLKNDQMAEREKRDKKDNNMRELKDDLQMKKTKNKLMRRNLENMLKDDNEDEEDLRNVPNPICQTEGKKKIVNQLNAIDVNRYINNINGKDDTNAKYHKLNERDFFKPSSRLHCDEKEAEQIVQEFFTNKLMKH